MKKFLILSFLILIFSSCSAGDDSSDSNNSFNNMNNNNNTNGGNVNIGGVQDIGLFRDIIDNGGVPAPSTFSDNGFFSEHYIEYPFENCGENICMNGMLGRDISVISNDYMNVIQVVLKSWLDPSDYERPPTDFIMVIDVSGSMDSDQKMVKVREGLHLMVDGLKSTDRMSIISFSDWATQKMDLVFADSQENRDMMHSVVSTLIPGGSTNIYEGLEYGFDKSLISQEENRNARIVLLSDGVPTSGNTDAEEILNFAKGSVSEEVQLTSIGVGQDINYDLMKNLALEGGNFYFIENSSALTDIFVTELNYFSFPIAKEMTLTVHSQGNIQIGDSVGFGDNWIQEGNGGSASFPTLYLASRNSNTIEDPYSRRGGGSALFLRVTGVDGYTDLGSVNINLRYLDPEIDDYVEQYITLGELTSGGVMPVDSYYSDYEMKKSTAMLNAYLGLLQTITYAQNWQYQNGIDVLLTTRNWVQAVNEQLDDDDLEADILLMDKLYLNMLPYTNGDNPCYNCYYNEREDVHYGCSQGNGKNSGGTILFLILGILFTFRRKQA
ncbi:VWA domain-containing protein [Myxococcota bacterium]|nr:VWA domain-containing protein [Myxococcota bacterium]MBU1381873.1 VWA domain-containing protein [Myxococcota bacterium]MBU1497774.1 VWA domain-containing protein [Myxococcota bacterium]